ncbi:MAG: DUF192 domain-containing protein [Pseudomonadota bacterium]
MLAGLLVGCSGTGTGQLHAEDNALGQAQRLSTQPLMIRTRDGRQHFFTVEVADDPNEQRTGLMFRTELAEKHGMIFLYDAPRQLGMWMKNTLLSLDMIFLDRKGQILNIYEGAEPGSLSSIRSRGKGVGVIELAAGQARAAGLNTGDQVFHCHFNNFPCETTPPS